MNQTVDILIKRASNIIKDPIVLDEQEINFVEQKLGVTFPEDFKAINQQIGYESFDFFDYYSFNCGVIEETVYYRNKEKLPHNYLVLTSDDVSFLLLKLKPDNTSEVIWCDEPDFYNLCRKGKMEYKATVFKSFTDFYEFLLDEEEKLIEEEKKDNKAS